MIIFATHVRKVIIGKDGGTVRRRRNRHLNRYTSLKSLSTLKLVVQIF